MGRVTIRATTDQTTPGVPTQYSKVFSEEESYNFPLVRVWDHAIELKPGAPATIPGKSTPYHKQNRKKPMSLSRGTSNKEQSNPPKDPMQHPSFISERKMANCNLYKITEN
jgi:hypothetical protein